MIIQGQSEAQSWVNIKVVLWVGNVFCITVMTSSILFTLYVSFASRSAPASPTHGLQFHPPSVPPHPLSREGSPTKTAAPTVDAHHTSYAAAQNKPSPASPTQRLFAPVSQVATHTIPVVAAPLAVPGSQLARVVPAASLAVSVIKSAGVEPAKQVESTEMEKNGFSQSSEDESPAESPKADSKMLVSSLKQQVTTSLAGSVGECDYCKIMHINSGLIYLNVGFGSKP